MLKMFVQMGGYSDLIQTDLFHALKLKPMHTRMK